MSAPTQTRRAPKLPKIPRRESTSVPRSQMERLWLVTGGIVAFVMLLIGYFFFISPQRSNTDSVNQQAATARQQNAVLQARLDALREENKNLGTYQAQLAALEQALPSTSGISDFLRTLQSLGSATLTNVTSLTVGQPVSVSPVAAAQPSSTAAASVAPPPTATASAAPVANGVTAPGVYSLSITADVTGSLPALSNFLDQLQAVQPRAVLISNISLSGGAVTSSSGYLLNLTLKAFVAPTSQAEGSALAASPAASTSPSN